MNTNIFLICFTVFQIVLLVLIYFFLKKYIIPILNKKYEIKDKEAKNKKFEIYLSATPSILAEEVDKYIEKYVTRYIAYKFISKKIPFIKNDDEEKMILVEAFKILGYENKNFSVKNLPNKYKDMSLSLISTLYNF